ncbi:MAG: tRNA (cytidine(34)-2'-O)-methyltransferase [Clostridiales bacterium]|jgi:tRNA (cytidine/uridine-2'-O-)-methyltransferase|nr:tRNA (cytidine(34)-2'-O)-methyltransferase [Clostridiales bacterium]
MLNIVLHEPEIPYNTGNIGRTCVATGTALHLIRPLGFFTDDRAIKKAGLDYWSLLNLRYYDGFEDFLTKAKPKQLFLSTTKAEKSYADAEYEDGAFIVFGKESAGLPLEIRERFPDACVRIPMLDGTRSLNLSNSVAVVLYEALRQNRFNGMR